MKGVFTMGGRPDEFQVTNLEVLITNGNSGDPMMDVITVMASGAGGDAFDLLVTFEWNPLAVGWFGMAEITSDLLVNGGNPPIDAEANFYAESIGPGEDFDLGSNTVALTQGGDTTINPDTSKSVYQVRSAYADANTVFTDPAPPNNPMPGLYRIGCTVSVETPGAPPNFADAYYQQDLVIRVVER
jgi:hypothetical protein